MTVATSKAWTLIGVLAAAVVLAVGWTLLISPVREHAAEVQDELSSQVSANASAADAVAKLQQEVPLLKARQAEMAALRATIPPSALIPALVRDINASAALTGVTLDQITPATPAPLVAPAGGPSQAAPGGLQEIAISLGVTGSYKQTRNFLASLEAMKRGVLVHGLDMEQNVGGDAGTFKTTIRAGVFINPDLGSHRQEPVPTDGSAATGDAVPQASTPS